MRRQWVYDEVAYGAATKVGPLPNWGRVEWIYETSVRLQQCNDNANNKTLTNDSKQHQPCLSHQTTTTIQLCATIIMKNNGLCWIVSEHSFVFTACYFAKFPRHCSWALWFLLHMNLWYPHLQHCWGAKDQYLAITNTLSSHPDLEFTLLCNHRTMLLSCFLFVPKQHTMLPMVQPMAMIIKSQIHASTQEVCYQVHVQP